MRNYRISIAQFAATIIVIFLGLMIWMITPDHHPAFASSASLRTYDNAPLVPPVNDNFVNAQAISGTNGQTGSGISNVEATGEAGEPNHAGVSIPLNSVWFRWIAPANLSMTFRTFGTGLDTTLAVYTGSAVNALTLVAANDNAPNGQVSSVTFIATSGTTYQIAVDGKNALTGTLTGGLAWHINFAESHDQFDFDGFSGSDFAVYRPGNNTWYILNSSTGILSALAWGASGDFRVPGAYDGSLTSICVWRPTTGIFYKAAGLVAGDRFQQWGTSGDIPVQGDFDGDDRADFAVWRGSNAIFYVLRSSDVTLLAQAWGVNSSTDVIAPGDYDGDGKTDFGVFRIVGAQAGTFYVLRSSNGSLLAQQWGVGTDIVVPGDYDGDGKNDIAVYRQSNSTFYALRSSDGGLRAAQWGISGDQLAPGDYDSDNKTDFTVWRASTGTFYVLRSLDGALQVQPWGTNGDVTIASSNTH